MSGDSDAQLGLDRHLYFRVLLSSYHHLIDSCAMERLPPEICTRIFSYACVDTGVTGRSLSQVSRYIRDTSQSTKLQSIAIRRSGQISSFLSLLRSTPEHLRRVRYLHVWNIDAEGRLANHSYDCELWSRTEKEITKEADDDSHDVQEILHLLAGHLKILNLAFNYSHSTDTKTERPLLSMPRLTELMADFRYVFRSQDERERHDTVIECPSLRRLHLTGARQFYGSYLYDCISKLAPSLSHLRFSGANRFLVEGFEIALGVKELPLETAPYYRLMGMLPTSVEMVIVEPAAPPPPARCGTSAFAYRRLIAALDEFNGRCDRFLLLPAPKNRRQKGYMESEAEWMDSLNGQLGCWWAPSFIR